MGSSQSKDTIFKRACSVLGASAAASAASSAAPKPPKQTSTAQQPAAESGVRRPLFFAPPSECMRPPSPLTSFPSTFLSSSLSFSLSSTQIAQKAAWLPTCYAWNHVVLAPLIFVPNYLMPLLPPPTSITWSLSTYWRAHRLLGLRLHQVPTTGFVMLMRLLESVESGAIASAASL